MLIEAMCLSLACVTSFNSDFHGAGDVNFPQGEAVNQNVKFKFKKQKRNLKTLRDKLREYDLKWELAIKRNTTVVIDLNDPEDFEITVTYIF